MYLSHKFSNQLLKIQITLPWKLSRLTISYSVFLRKHTFWCILIYFGSVFICRLWSFVFHYTRRVLCILFSIICCIWFGYLEFIYLFIKKIFFYIDLFLRERDRVWAREGQRERETQNPKQTPGSELLAQSPMRGLNPWTMRSWPEPK